MNARENHQLVHVVLVLEIPVPDFSKMLFSSKTERYRLLFNFQKTWSREIVLDNVAQVKEIIFRSSPDAKNTFSSSYSSDFSWESEYPTSPVLPGRAF